MMPASLNVLRCHDSRDWASSRSAISSQTQRSPSSKSVTTSTRMGSDRAWKSSAVRAESIRVAAVMLKNVASFLDGYKGRHPRRFLSHGVSDSPQHEID